MAKKKVGALIKEARTDAGLTQEQLAKKVKGVTASDISKAERGEKELTKEQLKTIAKVTGVTQKSLLDAAGSSTSSSSSSTSSTASKTSMKVSSTEKRLVELYRAADTATKKEVMDKLRGKDTGGVLGDLLENVVDSLLKK